jgi:type IV pilus assembly protein PilO
MDREALVKKLETLSRAQKLLILVLTVALLGAAYWYFLFRPEYESMQRLKKDIAQLENTIRNYRHKVARLPELEKKLKAQQREFVYAKTLLPESSSDVEDLLSEIEKLGNDNGLEFLLFSPGKETMHDFYASRKVQLRLEGPFHNLMHFFSQISRLDRLVTLENLQLRPGKGRGPNDEIVLNSDSQISIYRTLTEAELAAKKKKKR